MSKDNTFYFPHDYNVRTDNKIKKLIFKHGYEGYGIFWSLIEDLYNNANALRLDYDCIAYELRVDYEKIKSVINDFDLFKIEGDFFSSDSVQKRLNRRNEKSVKARESAQKRWSNANALQSESEPNAIKERKRKEIKEKEIDTLKDSKAVSLENSNLFRKPNIPTKEQVWEVFSRAGGTKEMAKSFYEKHEATGWYFNNSPIKDFSALANRFIESWKKNDEKRSAISQPAKPTKIILKSNTSPEND